LSTAAARRTRLNCLAVNNLITDRLQPETTDANHHLTGQCEIHTTADMDCLSIRNVRALVAGVVENRVSEPRRHPRARKLEAPSHGSGSIDGDFAGSEPLVSISRWRTESERRSEVQSRRPAP